MKLNQTILLGLLLLSSFFAAAQAPPVQLRSDSFTPANKITQAFIDSFNSTLERPGSKDLLVLQFERLPSEESRKILSAGGVELLDYIPSLAYTASISGRLNYDYLLKAGVYALFRLSPEQKMEERLVRGSIPSWASKTGGTVDLWISFPKTFQVADVMSRLREKQLDILSSQLAQFRILSLRISPARIKELAALPFVEFVQLAPKGDELLLTNSRALSRANLLNACIANGGKGLDGSGVVVGVGDNADVQTHIDFSRRLINRAPMPLTAGHGHHVTGIVGGAGYGNEMYQGYAPKATLISQGFNGIIMNASTYVNDYGMVLTNNSYGDNIECDYYGTYDLYSRLLDQMAIDLPYLQNVFSSGNSGAATCAPFLPNYHTVLGGYQSAKNVLTVGATNDSGAISGFSSRGPVKDGRTKPEIVAMGQFVASTWSSNQYSYNNGTSMAGPAATGGLALLIQRYRQLNGNTDPKNGLMKAILANGGADRGNAGPDYQYGFGNMNLLRSVDMIENNRYVNNSVANTASNDVVIAVPANTALLKVMLYWNDPAAAPISAKTLVNDIDLEVIDPASFVVLPRILDTSRLNVGLTSVNGVDRLNNMEQVVISQPATGNYTLRVKGTTIAQNPSQEYFLVYDIIPVELRVTAPAGGEAWHPSTFSLEMMKVSWEAHGFSSGTVTIEFSSDNGSNWSTIASGININRQLYTMFVPNVVTDAARIRITKDGSGETTMTGAFTIIGRPTVSLAPVQCEGYISMNWTAVAGVTDYEVMLLRNGTLETVNTTTATSYTFSGLSKDSVYWFTVMPRINGKGGRRAAAISRQPNTGTCAGAISNNDLAIEAVLAPATGRLFTSTQLTATTTISARIKNLDDAAVNNFDMKYSINGAPFITENVSATVNAGATYVHNFSATADLSATGNYDFVVVVKNINADPVTVNDTIYYRVKHLPNTAIDLTSDFLDQLETAGNDLYEKDTIGLTGVDRYDFSRSTLYGRLRTFVNSGMAYSGTKAFTLDANRYHPAGNTNYLTGTFNLVNYNVASNDIRLDFRFNNHGQFPHATNKVWIRGNDLQPWIEVYDLDDEQDDPGAYIRSASIEIADVLAANGQAFGTSFQVRWGQWGQIAATEPAYAGGYSFDDIRLYEVFNDLQMISIDTPVTASCGLTNVQPVRISVRNSSNAAVNNVPVRYRVNNGAWTTENIPVIAANTTIQYDFTATADFSATGNYLIEAEVNFPGDSFNENDTISTRIVNSPVISSFPYLEGFETGAGSWHTGGRNSSWEYGTPSSNKINSAANGAKAWKTRLAGHYNDNEYSFLYSPCFDVTGMTVPTLSFSMAHDLEDCGNDLCDGAWVEYSTDGVNWIKLGAQGQGTNWYNKAGYQLWSQQNFTRWHVATIPLPTGASRLRLRFVMFSDAAVNREGVAVDDIHVYDNVNGIYDGVTMGAPVSQTVSGNNWIDFTSGGKLVASIHPNNQVMGATDVQAYINTAAVRHTTSQYYHDRNITIKPTNTLLGDSVLVRFYFLESETDTLVKATGCNTCDKPSSAYKLGVSKYSDPVDDFENGTIGDDIQGTWDFIIPANVRKVPFDKGYYAEFKVLQFSEFWLNNGWFTGTSPLPLKLLDFTTQRNGEAVDVRWKTGSEEDVSRFEIEVSRENPGGPFNKIGEVASHGNNPGIQQYLFTDLEPGKSGTRYYRLKVINLDGSFFYSPVKSVLFDDVRLWQVFPNPSQGRFSLAFRLNQSEILKARVLDAKGSLVKEYHKTGDGILQKLEIDLGMSANGVYLLQVEAGSRTYQFKLFKH